MKGHAWTAKTIKHVLTSEAALGYLMHDGRPVTGADGRPTRIAEPLWDRPTHDALVTATAPRRSGSRAPKGAQLLSGIGFCGNCGARLYLTGRRAGANGGAYGCTGRVRGIRSSAGCKPAPAIGVDMLDAQTAAWFLARYGAAEVMRKVYNPGTGHAAQIAELEATQTRLRDDRQAGLYDSPKDSGWYRAEYQRLGDEITGLRALPDRKPGMRSVGTGRTVAQSSKSALSCTRPGMTPASRSPESMTPRKASNWPAEQPAHSQPPAPVRMWRAVPFLPRTVGTGGPGSGRCGPCGLSSARPAPIAFRAPAVPSRGISAR
jgi:site-specific DNA recombinase